MRRYAGNRKNMSNFAGEKIKNQMKRLCHYISEYMALLVLAAALLALAFPDALRQVRPTAINYLLGVVMFGMGLTLNRTSR